MKPWKVILWLKGGVNLTFLLWLGHASLNPGHDYLLSTGMHTEVTFSILIICDLVLLAIYSYRRRIKQEATRNLGDLAIAGV